MNGLSKTANRFRKKLGLAKMRFKTAAYRSYLDGLLRKLAWLNAEAVDQVATNRVKSETLPPGHFTPEDVDLQAYLNKVIELYYVDVKKVHYDKWYKRFLEQGYSEDEATQLAEQKILEISTRAANKAIDSHQEFLSHMRQMNIPPGSRVFAPGAGFAHEQVVDPSYQWVGLEYQKPLAEMATERNKQLGIPGETRHWSFIEGEPGETLGEEWADKLNTIRDEEGNPVALYLKHACGGITDGSLKNAVDERIKYIFAATCCANRYIEVSYRVLNPTHDDGSPMSLEEYTKMAKRSKRQTEEGRALVNKIDDFRQKYLEDNGYTVERGEGKHGPYLKAWLKE
jgi:hypothetical protein